MNLQSRVWIYQSNRALRNEELILIKERLSSFISSWTAHNQALKAAFEIRYDRFLVLIVDETQAGASGCSIDKSVHLMKDIEQQFHINLFDRLNMAWKMDEQVHSSSKEDFEELLKQGKISSETIVFNNLVSDYEQYLHHWEIPFKDSWHAKVFKLESIL
ncbi:MAG: ABC transporter ATPase [Sphingobacteriales bacterium]|nr:ABC transporter ATPase [Sphingobacteriales bacterium]